MPHANRSKRTPSESANPDPKEVRAARDKAGLTQTQAAELIHSTLRAWQNWESEDESMGRRMHPGLFELFKIKTGQHRTYGEKE